MKVLLVNMPWAATDVPSLALGILKSVAADQFPDAEVDVLYANLDYVDWCTEITTHEYSALALDAFADGHGDWIFSSALYNDPVWHDDLFTGEQRELSRRLHKTAPEFIETLAERIVAMAPDVVGFTCVFHATGLYAPNSSESGDSYVHLNGCAGHSSGLTGMRHVRAPE